MRGLCLHPGGERFCSLSSAGLIAWFTQKQERLATPCESRQACVESANDQPAAEIEANKS